MKKLLSVLSSTLQGGLRGGLLILALLATTSLWAYDFQSGDLYYNITSDSTVAVTYQEYNSSYASIYTVTVPETITYDGTTYSVTSIGNYDFQSGDLFYNITSNSTVEVINAYNTHSITIPRTVTYESITYIVTSIGEAAFNGCSSLTSISIPNSITSIGDGAFYLCSSLTSITLPNSVTSIGYNAFFNCISLTKTNYTGDIAGWCNIKFGSHNANPMYFSHNFYINDQEIKDLVIPNNVTSIGSSAFYCCSSLTSVTIPNSVTSIGDAAFYKCSSLTSVTIGNSVTSIGNYAFYFCSSLTSITIPEGVTSIGDRAFQLCSSLTSINIPNNVTSIGEGTFYNCSSLTSITLPNSVTSIGYYAFFNCSSLTSINIPNNVTSIGNYAFRSCSSLTSINIPNSITSIGEGTFYNCSSLTSATIGNSVTSIGAEAFYCVNLEEIYCYPTTPPTITEENTFKNYNATLYVPCDSKEAYEEHPVFGKFEKIKGIDDCGGGFVTTHIHETICQGEVYEFGEYLCDTTGTYTAIIGDVTTFLYLTVLPSSIDTITVEACDSYEWRGQVYTISGDYTFHGDKEDSIERCHTEILHLTISKSKYKEESIVAEGSYEWHGNVYTESGDYVSTHKTVNGCDSILELHLKIVPTERENNIIYYTSNSGEVITPYATDVFGANILSNTYENGLGVITFDGAVTTIGWSAFYEEINITSIVLPNTVTSIGHTAFCGCQNLTSIVIPDKVTSIGWSAFTYCFNLASINLPASVNFIDECAFESCESLTSIEIPDGVKSIKKRTFLYCRKLESVVIPNSVTSIGEQAFTSCRSLTSITMPNKLKTIGTESFLLCSSLTSITIPKSVTNIKNRAFSACVKLVSIVVEDGNTTYDSRNNCNAIIETSTNTLVNGCVSTIIPNDIVSIADGAFWRCSFSSITIPNSVTKIGNEAFSCSALDTIYCYAITPPELYDEKVFYDYNAILNVPCSALESYKSHEIWGKFTNIQCFEPPVEPEPQDTTIYHPTEYVTICEGTIFVWMGMEFTEAGTYTYEEIEEDENYTYHHIYTLELTVIPPETVVLVEEAYDSYEWHGMVYTESGVYKYEEWCYQEILHLTIIPSEDKEYVYEYHNYLVCDADIFVDPITGSTHVISSLIPFSLTWSDTIIGTNIDTIHTFNITPIVSPEPLTEDMLYAIGAVPRLVAGEKVDIAGTTELIMAYYQMVDQHDIADVIGVEWVAGHDVVLDTEQTTHTMVLEVWDECDYRIPKEFTFPVSKKDSEPQDTTIYISSEDVTICEGITFVWMGMEFTEEGIYTYEEIVVEDDYIYHYIYTLHLMVLPPTLDMYEVTAYDSYEWHGEVYTESGVYTYSDPYNPCVIEELHLTIIDTPTIPTEYATICEGETYIWRGKQITEAGTYIYEEIVEDEDYTYHHTYTLELTVLPYETIEYEVEAYDSYVWHGIVYTESGTYTYQYECTTEVLYLTIIPSEDNQGEVVVEPSTNSVTITWQKDADADTYIIVIKQGDKIVCTLIFDAEGNLVSVNYLPGRESNKHGIQHAGLTSDSFQYTITGLTPSTDYTYTVTATDDSDNTISSYSGEFTTHHATSVENTNSQSPTIDCQKILYEDHIYILRDGKTYTIMGTEVK